METFRYLLSCLICFAAVIVITSNAESKPAQPGTINSIPIIIMGKSLDIRKEMTRAEVKSVMTSIIKNEATIDIGERLQYDVILVEGEAPVTIFFDFDKKGIVTDITIDSFEAGQNPPVKSLLEWLNTSAGKPKVNKKKGTKTWILKGWKIEHIDHGSGEGSVYSITLTLQQ
jgi:hypothetical protein